MITIVASLFCVFILNVLWAFYVLKIVPQQGEGNSLLRCVEDTVIDRTYCHEDD